MAVRLDNQIIVFSGGNSTAQKFLCHSEIFIYNLDNNEWKKFTVPEYQIYPDDRAMACALSVGKDTIYMHGGYVGEAMQNKKYAITCYNELWQLSRSKHKRFIWTQLYPDSDKCDPENKIVPSPRFGHKCWKYQSQIFFFGGIGEDPEKYLNSCGEWWYAESFYDVYLNEKKLYSTNQIVKYDPLSGEWTAVATTGSVPSPRCEFDLVELHGEVYLYGGKMGTATLAEFHILDMGMLSWTRLDAAVDPGCRAQHTLSALSPTELVIHGGSDASNYYGTCDTWVFEINSQTWREYTGDQDHRRTFHTATEGYNGVIIVGGSVAFENKKEISFSDMFHVIENYNPSSLEHIALRMVFKHKKSLNPKPHNMPSGLYLYFCDISYFCDM